MRPIIAALVPFLAAAVAVFLAIGIGALGGVVLNPISWFVCVAGFALSYRLARQSDGTK